MRQGHLNRHNEKSSEHTVSNTMGRWYRYYRRLFGAIWRGDDTHTVCAKAVRFASRGNQNIKLG